MVDGATAISILGKMSVGNVLTLIGIFMMFVIVLTIMSRIRRCPANKLLVISGKTTTGQSPQVIRGGMAFVWPLIQAYEYLDLTPMMLPLDVDVELVRDEGRAQASLTVTVAVSTEMGIAETAAVRLSGLPREQVQALATELCLGQARRCVATATAATLQGDRQTLMSYLHEALSAELGKVGMTAISLNVGDIQIQTTQET